VTRAALIHLRATHYAELELAHSPGPQKPELLATGLVLNIGDWWPWNPAVRDLLESRWDEYIWALVAGMVDRAQRPRSLGLGASWLQKASVGDERYTLEAEQRAIGFEHALGGPLLDLKELKFLHLRLRSPHTKLAGAAFAMGITVADAREIARSLFRKLGELPG
jgi:hypothetical protein